MFKMSDHSIQANYPTDGSCVRPTMTISGDSGTTWRALQFHFHAGSDHALDGVKYGAELHLVHQEVNGTRLAVWGVMVNPGAATNTEVFDDIMKG